MTDPFALDWGAATVDLYSAERRTAIHSMNVALTSVEAAETVIRYCRGRQAWCQQHLPEGTRQAFVFDVRGQAVPENARQRLLIFGQECPIQIRDR